MSLGDFRITKRWSMIDTRVSLSKECDCGCEYECTCPNSCPSCTNFHFDYIFEDNVLAIESKKVKFVGTADLANDDSVFS